MLAWPCTLERLVRKFRDRCSPVGDTGRQTSIPGLYRAFRNGWSAITRHNGVDNAKNFSKKQTVLQDP